MTSPVIQFKRGVLADLPGLRAGEPGFTTDSYDLYVGIDSTTATNQFVGSGRYWTVNSASTGSGVNLVEGTSNGTSFITLKSPDSLSGIVTYTMPGTDGSNGDALVTNGSGTLSFTTINSTITLAADSGSNDTYTTGETLTFSGTANEVETTVSDNEITFSLPATINANTSGNAATADQIKTQSSATNATHYLTFVDANNGSATAENLLTDAGVYYNPFLNQFSANGVNTGVLSLNSVDVTSTAAELNVLDGIPSTLTATELGYVDGVTSAIQTQLDAKGTLANQNALITLSGVSAAAENLGTFSGSTLTDNVGIKSAIQELETSLETVTGGNAQAATVAVGATDTDASHFLTFVDSNNTSPTQEIIETDAGLSYNPSSNTLTATNISGTLTGNVTGNVTGNADSADQVKTQRTNTSAAHYLTFVDGDNSGSAANESLNTSLLATFNPSNGDLVVSRITASNNFFIGATEVTATAAELNVLDGIASLDTDISSVSSNDDTLASAKAIKTYVDSQVGAVDVEFGTAGDSGTGTVNTSQSLTIAGTSNEVETSASGQSVTIGLPAAVTVTTSVTTPTVKASAVQANDGTAAITITDSTGAVACNQNLTVGGNLIVNGSTTQVNTSQTTIEDQLLELGMVDGSAPSSDLNKDIGVLFNYYTDAAKKAAVYWDDSASRIVVSAVATESSGVLTNTTAGALEIGSLYLNDCAGNTQVISCSGSTRSLENITIDGGSF